MYLSAGGAQNSSSYYLGGQLTEYTYLACADVLMKTGDVTDKNHAKNKMLHLFDCCKSVKITVEFLSVRGDHLLWAKNPVYVPRKYSKL